MLNWQRQKKRGLLSPKDPMLLMSCMFLLKVSTSDSITHGGGKGIPMSYGSRIRGRRQTPPSVLSRRRGRLAELAISAQDLNSEGLELRCNRYLYFVHSSWPRCSHTGSDIHTHRAPIGLAQRKAGKRRREHRPHDRTRR